ncbi:MAG: hypothetical protein LVQ75_01420 [Candidatus Babeliales bacterium]|jgi:hypothetical protein
MNQPATPFADRLRQAAAQQPAIDVDALEDEAAAAQLPPTKESLKNRKRKRDGNGDVDENPSQRRRRFSKESPVDEATMDTDDEDL